MLSGAPFCSAAWRLRSPDGINYAPDLRDGVRLQRLVRERIELAERAGGERCPYVHKRGRHHAELADAQADEQVRESRVARHLPTHAGMVAAASRLACHHEDCAEHRRL